MSARVALKRAFIGSFVCAVSTASLAASSAAPLARWTGESVVAEKSANLRDERLISAMRAKNLEQARLSEFEADQSESLRQVCAVELQTRRLPQACYALFALNPAKNKTTLPSWLEDACQNSVSHLPASSLPDLRRAEAALPALSKCRDRVARRLEEIVYILGKQNPAELLKDSVQ